ncbi:hypothetical protein CO058_00650 [candidate division WWE3 bacterium CG_4_9_14_0_2_um_filter_35_11]|uniref:LytR/CpsA/Psr regulator C-terminal domain-containing protein n=1 Tax=candidate division WWE3 bacterium CG_4_9_14_0_2_um_filter_35_11 TaxID=1975077 RepID=A0A2M8EMN8_UNCKA|nr:MAG: hypothetical protein COV25_01470 [candidate division WWE3 bacterium CG10_big_fil_rev_8_21_14_0_10_35_32]PJC23985.1 MAG: hypothetical protein CO058_00650 [candidate division WWE3 bacterium CG_4_9_14_0_2_um_filter_35_11]
MFSLPFSKKSGLLYVKRDKAQLYVVGSSSSIEVVFDSAVFENLEVKDKDAFESSIKEIIQRIASKNISILIVLSSDIVFRKDMSKISDGELDQEINKFIDAIPMDNDSLDYRIMPVETGVAVVATNTMIYNIARDAVESLGSNVIAIVPAAFFGVTTSDITLNVFAQIAKANVSFGEADFMRKGPHGKIVPNPISVMNKNRPVNSSGVVEVKSSISKKSVFLVILTIILFGISGFLIKKYYLDGKDSKVTEQPKLEMEVVSEAPAETPAEAQAIPEFTIEEVKVDKSDLRLSILNSTKISGLASKAKDAISKLGYSDFEVGNSKEVLTNVQIILYKDIPKEYLAEISESLKETFKVETIDVKEDFKEVFDFDIQIILAGITN